MVLNEEKPEASVMRGTITHKTTRFSCANYLLGVVVRLMLFIVFIKLESLPAFKRKIHEEELWLYKNPPSNDYVPAFILMPASFLVPFLIICLNFVISHDRNDFTQGNNVITLSLGINGVITNLLKVTVGRPRPDFFYRCFPNGVATPDLECTGNLAVINEGRKSFPSGHSSFAFAGYGFIFLYLTAKLHVFNEKGRGQAWRLCVALSPLVFALLVAVSRTCDYHHHWQDVTVGSAIGMTITFLCYRQYYPSIFSTNPERPFPIKYVRTTNCLVTENNLSSCSDQNPLVEEEEDSKWI